MDGTNTFVKHATAREGLTF